MQGERQFGLTNGAEVNENNHTYDDDDLMAMMETWPPDSVELSSLWQILIYLLILHFPLCCCQFVLSAAYFSLLCTKISDGERRQVWCEVKQNAHTQATRQQAGLETVEKLQNVWRQLKRDEKVTCTDYFSFP
jgi:hypothetical protein